MCECACEFVCVHVWEYRQNKLQFGLRLRLQLEFDCYRNRQSVIDCHCLHSLVWCERTNTYWNACEMLRSQSKEPPGWRSCWQTTCRSRRCAAHARTCCNPVVQWACRKKRERRVREWERRNGEENWSVCKPKRDISRRQATNWLTGTGPKELHIRMACALLIRPLGQRQHQRRPYHKSHKNENKDEDTYQ